MGTTTLSTDATEKTLAAACARDAPVELHYEHPGTQKRVVGKARMLQIAEGTVLVDTPKYADGVEPIPVGRPITAMFALDENRFAFLTAIEQTGVRIQLNDMQKLRGVALRRPQEVEPVQRRSHYRVRLAGFAPVPVSLCHVHPSVPDACPIDGQFTDGTMFNLSAGGVALVILSINITVPKPGDLFYLSFPLPESDDEVCMLGRVSYAASGASNRARLGFEFQSWGGQDFKRCTQEITKAITNLERALLRRKR